MDEEILDDFMNLAAYSKEIIFGNSEKIEIYDTGNEIVVIIDGFAGDIMGVCVENNDTLCIRKVINGFTTTEKIKIGDVKRYEEITFKKKNGILIVKIKKKN